MRLLQIPDETGHTVCDLDTELDLAEKLFAEAINKGYVALVEKNNKKEISHIFVPDADLITMITPYAGG